MDWLTLGNGSWKGSKHALRSKPHPQNTTCGNGSGSAMSRALKIASALLAMAAGGYFALHAYRLLSTHDLSTLVGVSNVAALLLLTFVYAATIATTAGAWSRQLYDMGQPHGFGRFSAILASTQFGKYLPGNVGQHVGRVALAMRAGVEAGAATLSVAYELLLAVTASTHITAIALLLAPPEIIRSSSLFEYRWLLLVAITLGAVAGLMLMPEIAAWLMRRRSTGAKAIASAPTLRLGFATVLFSYLMYVLGVVAIGFALWVAAHVILEDATLPGPLFFVAAFAGSWILGFLAPGAPAGLGVREAVLTAWLSQSVPAASVVVLVIGLRIATTFGDLLNFLWGTALVVRRERTCT